MFDKASVACARARRTRLSRSLPRLSVARVRAGQDSGTGDGCGAARGRRDLHHRTPPQTSALHGSLWPRLVFRFRVETRRVSEVVPIESLVFSKAVAPPRVQGVASARRETRLALSLTEELVFALSLTEELVFSL